MPTPFVLLDDARAAGASPARLYEHPREVVVARTPHEIPPALERLAALAGSGLHLAGHIAYEAGLALEPKLAALGPPRTGANGPLLWFGAFEGYTQLAATDVPAWLTAHAAHCASRVGPLEPALSPGGYTRAFEALQAAIEAGDIYQANLTFPLTGSWSGDPLALYAMIRSGAAAGYGGIVHDGADWLLSFSPELFVAVKARAATVKPMKGTRPRGRDAAEDARLAADLAHSVKDRAENLMIVDLLRNDLSRVSEPGSVRTERPFAVESYPTVHQMTTTVRSVLREAIDLPALIAALFPCGSITGAPKIRAMELIGEIERDARGPYCGAIGRIDPTPGEGPEANQTGDTAFNVAIRTLRLTTEAPGRGRAVLGVGSAVVADSDALGEWRECLVKGGFVTKAAPAFDLIETMAFTPETGIPLLERHLARLTASAGALGFAFDRHAVRNAIQALCFEAEAPGKVRLLLARSGATSLEIGPMPDVREELACAVLTLPVDPGDIRLTHKTTDRSFYEAALRAARGAGADEALLIRDDGLMTEGSFTNLFVERDGALLTPPARLGLLPGVLRASLIEEGRAREAELSLGDLAGGFWLGNAVRGLVRGRLLA